MATEMKVEVISKETIKPSSPTPHHLRISNLSVFDQVTSEVYVQLLLFYPSSSDEVNNIDHHHSLFAERSILLKTSLSETLTYFYPLAGEFKYNSSISCNDHGAAFVEARVNCPISQILGEPDLGMQKQLVPNHIECRTQSGKGYLLLVQANFFECGGVAIGVTISHKAGDAHTFSKFINSWAAIALGSTTTTDVVPPAQFGAAASLLPPLEFLNSPQPPLEFVHENCSKAASTTVPNPTRVEVVSALIWKCVMEASRSNLGSVRPSAWCQVVNMRKIMDPPMTVDLLGNFFGYFVAKTEESEVNHDVQSLVAEMRKGFEEFKVNFTNGISGEDVLQLCKELGDLIGKVDTDNNYCSTSWCRFPFYKANFGWGKPSWISIPAGAVEIKNIISLMDERDGNGIEARLSLKEENMALVESNQELLAYASLNPSVVL
ncbi:BAHD acyltransferase [Prunus yedoensis var. nudiflora]|uniref:BAHD acyltransferase n=1 Tax=Prunus yedoensis var. nudiflora TaxID=2094558 RepID=A0A314Z3I3_PRUYE|nr:BAHD acyltransferase [Prunus yedoensis var. nudiflora]